MAEVQATPVSQLPSNGLDMGDETQDNEIVNEILSEIDHQNMKGNPNMSNNSNIFQRNVDQEVNSSKGMMPEPTQEQILSMNQQMSQDIPPENHIQQQQQQPTLSTVSEEQNPGAKNSDSLKILSYLKDTIAVIVLVFLFSLPIFNMLLLKIPKAMSDGSPTMIGKVIKALLAGAIFFVVSKFI